MFRCTTLALPAGIRREATRPQEFRDARFDGEFDSSTLFYDLISVGAEHGSRLVGIGPPFANLFPAICRARICGKPIGSALSNCYFRDRCNDIWLPHPDSDVVQFDFDFGSYRLTPQPSSNRLYAGRRVLYTLSKDNELRWMIDWVRFHARNHGANGVLIYDNASTRYAAEELESWLRERAPGLEINVVHWPYKYGPQGISKDTWWDSDFCQAAAFQDARLRFLSLAGSVLNCDVDEFVVSGTGQSIFQATERSRDGCVMFFGRWVSNATSAREPAGTSPLDIRHRAFRFLERAQTEPCPRKWCVVPQRCKPEAQWRTHMVWGKDIALCHTNAFSYRHFRGISTNWKYQRYQPARFDPTLHEFDPVLSAGLLKAGMVPPGPGAARSLPSVLLKTMLRQARLRPTKVLPAANTNGLKSAEVRSLAVDPRDSSLGGNMIGGDPNTYHPALWQFLVERFSIESILDVGCGEGHCVQYFSGMGVRASGFDGLQRNVEQAVVPVALHDLRLGPFTMPVDLVHCCEVVEHIDEEYLPNLLDTLANGRIIAMTHAVPGQTGYHHVNCQVSDYWIEKLETRGYAFLPEETREAKARIRAAGTWTYFIQSGLIFERRDSLAME